MGRVVGLGLAQSGHDDVKSSECKSDALVKLRFGFSKHTFQYTYLVTTYLL